MTNKKGWHYSLLYTHHNLFVEGKSLHLAQTQKQRGLHVGVRSRKIDNRFFWKLPSTVLIPTNVIIIIIFTMIIIIIIILVWSILWYF